MTGDCSVAIRAGIALATMAGALALPARAQQLSPQEVIKRVSPSVVVIEVREYPEGKPSRMVALGSGVVVPSRNSDETLIATNCHLTDKSPLGAFLIKQGESSGLGVIYGRDSEILNQPKYPWREFDTLGHVIGDDEITTKRVLLELDARASENGKPLWGLVSRNPLPVRQ